MRTATEIATAFAATDELTLAKPFYFVGIGGAGMSAMAAMLKRRGARIAGSDSTPSPALDWLTAQDIGVDMGHAERNLSEPVQLVLTDAIDLDDSPEVRAARSNGSKLFRRSQVLGWLLRDKRVIAVTGTHGKTTTTAMIGAGLLAAQAEPTIVVGAHVPDFDSSFIEGSGQWAAVEACEAYDGFHDLDPFIVVLPNLELDHVDFHGAWENLKASVARFVARIPDDGALIFCQDDPGACEIAAEATCAKIPYSAADATDLALAAPGAHNRSNATAALLAIERAGLDPQRAKPGIESFRGAQRRLQTLWDPFHGEANLDRSPQVAVVDDYAHHPTEIRASIAALRERYPDRRLVVVYQPHLYSRTANLIPDFAEALSAADEVVLTDIYPAREEPLAGVSSARIAELITVPCAYVPSRRLLPRKVRAMLRDGDVVVGMGAGNIDAFAPELLEELERPTYEQALAGRKLNVCVVCGGDSAEREVSLHSGRAVEKALRARGHSVQRLDLTDRLLDKGQIAEWVGVGRPDVVFLAVHGTNAEDGAIQGALELLHLPYTGSNVQSSAIAMNKALTKEMLRSAGAVVPRGVEVSPSASVEEALDLVAQAELKPPLIVKPNAQGSTVGLSFIDAMEELPQAIAKSQRFGATLIEERIDGMEVSVPALIDVALAPVEIAPISGRYDFASKYLPGATEEIAPARVSPEQLARMKDVAVRAHRALGCAGVTRTDMIARDGGEGEIVVLEVNTVPGLTATSLLPKSAAAEGISMEDLCERMALDALKTYAERP